MFNYPNGKKFNNLNKIPNKKEINLKASYSAANRGMNLEESINISNDFYIEKNIALITTMVYTKLDMSTLKLKVQKAKLLFL